MNLVDPPTRHARLGMFALATTVGVSAFLLFGMEPLVGRLVVRYYGGAVHVWLICLMFFQAILFAGYLYAHVFAQRIGRWHLLVLLLPLLALPLDVQSEVAPEMPVLSLLMVLFRYVALPFFVLSTTAVVLQSWLARSSLGKTHEPYPLYSASNIGSLTALLGYPFIVEPFLGLVAQRYIWSAGYLLYAVMVGACWWVIRPSTSSAVEAPVAAKEQVAPTAVDVVWWLLLSALPSAFLLATTNLLANEVGSFPMVWVIPLALYLGTFIWTFREGGGVPRLVGAIWIEILLAGGLVYLLGPVSAPLAVLLVVVLPMVSLIAHGMLYDRRPHPKWLTHYYLTMSLGGWVGGALVTFGAPSIFDGLYEYPLLLLVFTAVFAVSQGKGTWAWFKRAPIYLGGPRLLVISTLLVVCVFGATVVGNVEYLVKHRNFYGTYRIADVELEDGGFVRRNLSHGQTLHGAEMLTGPMSHLPVGYYHPDECLHQVYASLNAPRRTAVIGLGAGVMASFTEPSDVLHYYEIDADNEGIARRWFTYMSEAKGSVEVRIGDGRLRMAESTETYDLVQIDAFSGDGIPAHLLTHEAVSTYVERLSEDGIILFHVSNRYYELRPLVKRLLEKRGYAGVWSVRRPSDSEYVWPSRCVVAARDAQQLERLVDLGWIPFADDDGIPETSLWTDDYANMLSPMWYRMTLGLDEQYGGASSGR
jgi:spermidine synthase